MLKSKFNKLVPTHKLVIPALAFLVLETVFVVIYFFSWDIIHQIGIQRVENRFDSEVQTISSNIERIMGEYELVLLGARGFYNSSDVVERDEWKTYVELINIPEKNPAINSMAYVKKIESDEHRTYFGLMTSELGIVEDKTDVLHFHPKQEGSHFVIQYYEPYSQDIGILGLDFVSIGSNEVVIAKAIDTNTTVISEPLDSIENSGEKNRIFLVVLPVYENGAKTDTLEERRDSIQGLMVATIDIETFFKEAIFSSRLTHIDNLSAQDELTGNSVLSFMDRNGLVNTQSFYKDNRLVQKARLNLGGRSWNLVYNSGDTVQHTEFEEAAPSLILLFGSLISFLVSALIFNVLRLNDEARKIADDLTEDLQKFKLAVENVSDQIVITDTDGVISYANPATEKITGFSMDEILGEKAGAKWGGLMKKEFYEKMWDTIKNEKKPFQAELVNKRKDGTKYDASVTLAPVKNDQGDILFFVGIERDISAIKQVERIKDEFVSVASHELRTPLTAIDGLVSMILDGDYGKVSSDLHQPLEDIKLSSERLIALVNDLLSVSRLEAGKLKYDLAEFDITQVIKQEIELLSVVAKQQNLKLLFEGSESLKVFADMNKVKQTINNLIGNALKFTKTGKITVGVKAEGELAVVSVTDTGVGIRQKDKDKLFKKFEQLETGRMRQAGTGLGLYISKQMCQKMGGDLKLAVTEPGRGSTFTFSVPLAGSKLAKKVMAEIKKEAKENPNQKSDLIEAK